LTPALVLFVAGFAAAIAFNIQLEDRRVMDEPYIPHVEDTIWREFRR
jgi:hypothetical protein